MFAWAAILFALAITAGAPPGWASVPLIQIKDFLWWGAIYSLQISPG